ncbi:MAG: hypothetical protein Q4Q07_02960, partial [Tissierellia bacterium]|nr:hypothetical protein [Tissierellia bacterium]
MVNKKTFILYPFFSFIGILVICLYNPIFDYITLAQILGWILFLEGVRFLEIKKREKKWEEDQEELLHLMEDIDGDVEEYKLHYHYLGPLRDEIQKYLVEKREGKKESERQKSTIKINMENMAHQIKTSITGSLLLLDLMEIEDRKEYR